MPKSEIEQVLENWIEEAQSPVGQIADGLSPAAFVAQNFVQWWRNRLDESLGDVESALCNAREELNRLGGWQKFGEALDEICRSQEGMADLRVALGLMEAQNPPTAQS